MTRGKETRRQLCADAAPAKLLPVALTGRRGPPPRLGALAAVPGHLRARSLLLGALGAPPALTRAHSGVRTWRSPPTGWGARHRAPPFPGKGARPQTPPGPQDRRKPCPRPPPHFFWIPLASHLLTHFPTVLHRVLQAPFPPSFPDLCAPRPAACVSLASFRLSPTSSFELRISFLPFSAPCARSKLLSPPLGFGIASLLLPVEEDPYSREGVADGTSGSRARSTPKRAPLLASARAAPAHATSVACAPGSHPAHPRSSPGAATPHAPAAASPRGRRRSGLASGRRASFPGCRRAAGLRHDPSAGHRGPRHSAVAGFLTFDLHLPALNPPMTDSAPILGSSPLYSRICKSRSLHVCSPKAPSAVPGAQRVLTNSPAPGA